VKHQSITRVSSTEHRRHAIQVSTDQQIRFSISVEVAGQRCVDGRKLRFDRQLAEGEGTVAVVESDSAGESVRFPHLRLLDIGGREDVFDSTGAEILVRREFRFERGNPGEELVATGKWITHPVPIRRYDLLDVFAAGV